MINSKKYDVVVVGGGTSGCAAAYTAGKLGLKTLLIEKECVLGGTITNSLVVPMMSAGKNQINTEFFNVLIFEMHKIGGQVTYKNNKGWLNPVLLKPVLDKLMLESGVEVYFNAVVKKVSKDTGIIVSLIINQNILSEYNYKIQSNQKGLSVCIDTKYIIDATGNSEICKLAKCKFLKNLEENQPFSLRFTMSGINISLFASWLEEYDKDRAVTTVERIGNNIHLSTAYTWDKGKKWALTPLFDKAVKEKLIKDNDRNYFQLFTIAGMSDSIAFNCPRIVKSDNFNNDIIEARQAILRLSDFCRVYFPGFKDAYISDIADKIGIRSSERIEGKYVYTINDIIEGKKFDHPVVISNYPVDIHSTVSDKSTLMDVGEYQLPIESLMSKEFKNLYVVGRGVSADNLAQGALRIQPCCFSMGEGVAKYIKSII